MDYAKVSTVALYLSAVTSYMVADGLVFEFDVSWKMAAVKCLPIIILMFSIICCNGWNAPGDSYALLISAGLFFSAIGDALLVFPSHFLPGMGAFGIAHVAFIIAFGMQPRAFVYGLMIYAVTVPFTLFVLTPPDWMKIPVLIYTVLLSGMAWRGGAAWVTGPPTRMLPWTTAIGSLLFVISDGFVGYSIFNHPLPYHKWLVMSTYYAAQLGIGYSALPHSPASAKSD